MAAMTKTMRQNIAACAVHGVYYWSDHPERGAVWATTDDQKFVEVQINRSRGESYLENKSSKKYTLADTLADVAHQLGYRPSIVEEKEIPVATTPRKKPVRKPAPPTVSGMTLKSALSLIRHDPRWLSPISSELLLEAVGKTDSDLLVRAELKARGVSTRRKSA